jgi:DNA-directed RNA polymerase subunit K/omega
MTYIQRKDVTNRIPNKFEAIKIAALEARRLNDRARAVSANLPGKLTTIAVQRLIDGKILYYDKRERAAAALKERETGQE